MLLHCLKCRKNTESKKLKNQKLSKSKKLVNYQVA